MTNNNSGHYNSGHSNSGNYNSGNYNSGHYNSSNYNSGHSNSGNYNSGNYNSGNYNSGNYNSGCFNTDTPTIRLFNTDSGMLRKDISIPYVILPINRWVGWNYMTEEEKAAHPKAKTTEGYLRVLSYKEAWQKAWSDMTEEIKQQFLDLPNFCPKIFQEITGIDTQSTVTVVANGRVVYISKESAQALGLIEEST